MTCQVCTLIKQQCRRCASIARSLAKGLGPTPVVTAGELLERVRDAMRVRG